MQQHYKSRLAAHGPNGAWTFLKIPFNVRKILGSKAQVKVAGTMNGFAFPSSLMPRGDGTHRLAVSKLLQAGAQAGPGTVVAVMTDIDHKERVVAVRWS